MSLFYSAGLGGSAIPDSVVDNFEDEDLSGWTSTSEFGTTTNRAYEGSVSAVKTSQDGSHRNMWWDSSLAGTDETKTGSAYFYPDSDGAVSGGVTLVNPSGDGYLAYCVSDEIRIYKVSEDSLGSQLKSTSITTSAGNWYQVRLQEDGSGGLTAEIDDDNGTQSTTVSDQSYNVDRVGVHQYSTDLGIDYVELTTK